MKKKITLMMIAVVLIVPIVSILALIYVPMKINDFKLAGFTQDVIENIEIPEKTSMVDYIAECGNSSGTGDHTDLYVIVLIESDLDYDTLASHFVKDEYFWRMQDVHQQGEQTIGMKCMDLLFDVDFDKKKNYYILEYNKSTILDFRGF